MSRAFLYYHRSLNTIVCGKYSSSYGGNQQRSSMFQTLQPWRIFMICVLTLYCSWHHLRNCVMSSHPIYPHLTQACHHHQAGSLWWLISPKILSRTEMSLNQIYVAEDLTMLSLNGWSISQGLENQQVWTTWSQRWNAITDNVWALKSLL